MVDSRVFRKGEKIVIQGLFGLSQLHWPLSCLHQAIHTAGYVDIVLDFSKCESASPASMLALCAQVVKLQDEGIDFALVLPKNERLQRLFRNANWAHFLDPRKQDPSTFRGYTQIPATRYSTDDDQFKAVDR